MTQEDKDKMISRYIALTPPLLGSPLVTSFYLGMDKRFVADLNLFSLGLTAPLFEDTLPTFESIMELSVSKFFRYHLNAPWMQAIK